MKYLFNCCFIYLVVKCRQRLFFTLYFIFNTNSWSSEPPTCQPISCGIPKIPINADLLPPQLHNRTNISEQNKEAILSNGLFSQVGQKRKYKCRKGFIMVANSTTGNERHKNILIWVYLTRLSHVWNLLHAVNYFFRQIKCCCESRANIMYRRWDLDHRVGFQMYR